MASIFDASTTPASNTLIGGINMGENCPPSGLNDAIRELAAEVKGALVVLAGGGSANAHTAAMAPAASALVDGMVVRVKAAATNTSSSCTFNLNGLGARTVVREDGADLRSGDIQADATLVLAYYATDSKWRIIGGRKPFDYVIGQFSYFCMPNPPTRWLECNGAAISRTTYAALFSTIGTAFGSGDGSTTFNLPQLRAEFIRGWDNGRGVDSGRAFGSAQAQAIQQHDHLIASSTGYSSGQAALPPSGSSQIVVSGNDRYSSQTGGAETRPRNIALLPCIYAGV